MAEIQPEKEKEDGEAVNFDYLRNIRVNVRRPDSVSANNVNLAVEYTRFLKSSYPDHKTKLVSVPKSFQYSNVKTHGIHSEGRRRLEDYEGEDNKDRKQLHTWVTATAGGEAEEKIFNMLTRKFSGEPCLLVNGFTENDLLKVVRENLKKQKEGKGTEMSEQERKFYEITNSNFSKIDEQVESWLESMQVMSEFSEQSLDAVFGTIKIQEPGKELLSEKNKEEYHKNFRNFLTGKMKNGKIYKKHELKVLCVRYLLDKTNPNSEFDILFFLKETSTVVHFEIKSMVLEESDDVLKETNVFYSILFTILWLIFSMIWTRGHRYLSMTRGSESNVDRLRKEYQDAKKQTEKGKQWFRETLSKIGGLQKWNYVCFVALPNLESRDVLKRNDIIREENELLNVITKEEINDETMKWWTDRMELNERLSPASDELFEKLQSIMVGSYYVTMHNNPSDIVKTREMILGSLLPSGGIGRGPKVEDKRNRGKEANDKGIRYKEKEKVGFKEGGRGPVVVKENRGTSSQLTKFKTNLQAPKFSDLKDKPLGSVPNIIFWNDPQRKIRYHVENMEHTLLLGDYGTGKTLILEAATQSLSKKINTEVVFIMALDYLSNSKKSDDILDIMFRQKYEGTNITFKSIAELRRDFASVESLSVLHLIESYVKRAKREDLVLIIDEMGVSDDDGLEETLALLADNTDMTLAAMSSTSLLDSRSGAGVSQTKFDKMIRRTSFSAVRLNNIMRSSKNIAAATSTTASFNVTRYKYSQIPETILPGSSSTVPGTRPRAMLYNHTVKVDHNKLAGFVSQTLSTLPSGIKIAVLCGRNISARKISDLLSSEASCYDGGIKMFSDFDMPEHRKVGAGDGGEAELRQWLEADQGVLVTSELQFRGCEADAVIYVTQYWGNFSDGIRSPVTRAVAHLCLITGDYDLSVPEMEKYWEVEIMEKGAGD